MASSRLNQEFDVFLASLDRPESERVGFVERQCAPDRALRDRVLELLANHKIAESQETTVHAGSGPAPVIPETIGPYTVCSRLGEGGMGVVYAAEQRRPIRRSVAVKLLKSGSDSTDVLARFDAERQALALMNHANVARILDAGVYEGRPYFVMERIAGVPITTYCDQRGLSTEDRLKLFLDVCEGVQHAHQKGIIHRDLKPSNVLVTDEGSRAVPKIIDFGIAKAVTSQLLDASIHTEIGRIIGTPDYMSPEQADISALDVDTRSDVYSLGALLYELLCGSTVFGLYQSRAGLDLIRSTILEKAPERASNRLVSSVDRDVIAQRRSTTPEALGRVLRQDLDWITQKALEKDRTRRYGSAAEVANDIHAYLRGEAVVARPPSAGYRIRKFVHRNRGAVAAGVVLAAAVATATVTSVLAAVTAQRQQIEAERRAEDLERIVRFEASRLSAIEPQAFGSTIRDLISEEAGEDAARLLEPINFTTIALRSIDRHVFDATIREIDAQFAGDPAIRASLLQSAASTMARIGLAQDALDPSARALELRRETLGADHEETAASLAEHAGLLMILDRFGEAEAGYREAISVLSRSRGPRDQKVLDLNRKFGLLLQVMGRYDDALVELRIALDGYRAQDGQAGEEIARTLNEIGLVYYEVGDQDAALEALREALDASRSMLGPDDPQLLSAMTNYGGALIRAGRLAEGAPYFEEALGGFRRIHGDDHPITLTMISNMGYLKQELGAFEEAEALYIESLETRRRVLGADHTDTVSSELNMANLYIERGDPELSEPLLLHAAEVRKRDLGESHPRTVNAYNNLASLYRRLGRLDEALHITEHLVGVMLPGLPARHSLIGSVWGEHARTLLGLNRLPEAAAAALRSHDARVATYGPSHPTVESAARLIVAVFEAWHGADPEAGHDTTAEHWSSQIDSGSGVSTD